MLHLFIKGANNWLIGATSPALDHHCSEMHRLTASTTATGSSLQSPDARDSIGLICSCHAVAQRCHVSLASPRYHARARTNVRLVTKAKL